MCDIFQNAIANVKPPIGLLNDRNAVNMIETFSGSDAKAQHLQKFLGLC